MYDRFKEETLQPWADARKHRPKRFRYFWNQYLEYLKCQRRKEYKIASVVKTEQAWRTYITLDRRNRTLAKARKRQCMCNQAEALGSASDRYGTKIGTCILRKTASDSGEGTVTETKTLELDNYAAHLSTPA